MRNGSISPPFTMSNNHTRWSISLWKAIPSQFSPIDGNYSRSSRAVFHWSFDFSMHLKSYVRLARNHHPPRAPYVRRLCPLGVCSVRTIRTGGPARSTRRSCTEIRVGSPVFGTQSRIPKFSMKCFGVESGLPPSPVNPQAYKACNSGAQRRLMLAFG